MPGRFEQEVGMETTSAAAAPRLLTLSRETLAVLTDERAAGAALNVPTRYPCEPETSPCPPPDTQDCAPSFLITICWQG
ncbi:MAG TPA: hypothetical protein VHI71_11775 [Actinomycetota bacterium]|nr:hypothetical protein [Actinomycetota bacterium]